MGTIAAELGIENKQGRSEVLQFLEWSRGQLTSFFSEKKSAGELKVDAQPQELADFCIAIMQGGMLLSKMRRDTEMFKNAASQALIYVHTLRTFD